MSVAFYAHNYMPTARMKTDHTIVRFMHNMPTTRMQTDHTGTANFRCVGISSFAVDECVGWLVQVSLTLFVVTGSARLAEGVNAKSMRLTCTSQPTHSSTVKLEIEIPTQRKSAVVDCMAHVHACKVHVHAHVSCMLHACNKHATCMFRHMSEYACFMHVTCM